MQERPSSVSGGPELGGTRAQGWKGRLLLMQSDCEVKAAKATFPLTGPGGRDNAVSRGGRAEPRAARPLRLRQEARPGGPRGQGARSPAWAQINLRRKPGRGYQHKIRPAP